ncbi:BLUF domain-containing protein [Desertivirga arenae]|uniref:BLUF domain-containing protein n=1 Tax=Desertivirga arenae TaxID=2810309 RepID=UPI001A96DAE9|nr:BLUF domain-containing protein [Pedobacter sp. SYSU D00823]
MYYLIYRSEAIEEMEDKALKAILGSSRKYNKEVNVTGMLLYFDSKFLQLLEGEEFAVKSIFRKICKDSRHHNIVILKEGERMERLFPGWSMSFRTPSPEEVAAEPGYKDIYTPGSPGALDLVKLFNLLRGKKASEIVS